MTITLYDTLSKSMKTFQPQTEKRVTMYVCGPTVYDFPHVGNARPAIVFDILYRLLKSAYPSVLYARNYTDIDDKIFAVASASAISASYLALSASSIALRISYRLLSFLSNLNNFIFTHNFGSLFHHC